MGAETEINIADRRPVSFTVLRLFYKQMTDLSPEQRARVEYLACDEWVVEPEDETQSWANFTGVLSQLSTIELHHFACNFNWDCGVKELDALIEHPQCDAGTALMVYWLGRPAEHYRLDAQGKLTPDAVKIVELLRKIETKVIGRQFTSATIGCDPFNIMGQPMTRGSERDRQVVPEEMFHKIDGVEIEPYFC